MLVVNFGTFGNLGLISELLASEEKAYRGREVSMFRWSLYNT